MLTCVKNAVDCGHWVVRKMSVSDGKSKTQGCGWNHKHDTAQ